MDKVLKGLDFVYCYIEDVLVASEITGEHLHHLERLFAHLRTYGILINALKCTLADSEVRFLGFHVSVEDLKLLSEKIDANQNGHNQE